MSRNDIVVISDASDGIVPFSSSPRRIGSPVGANSYPALVEDWTSSSDLDGFEQDDDSDLGTALARFSSTRALSSFPSAASTSGRGVPHKRKRTPNVPRSTVLPPPNGKSTSAADEHFWKRWALAQEQRDVPVKQSLRAPSQAAESSKETARQARRADKEATAIRRKLERDTAKTQKEAQQSYQRKLNEINRLRVSKTEALREIELHLAYDLSLPSSPISSALPELKERLAESLSRIHFLSEGETAAEGTIRFLRRIRAEWDGDHKRFHPLDEERVEWESTVVVVTSVDDIVDQIAEGENRFLEWLSDIRLAVTRRSDEQVFLLVRGLAKYHSRTVSLVNRTYRDCVASELSAGEAVPKGNSSTTSARVTKEMVETELLRAQVAAHVFVVLVDAVEEIEDWLYNLAADVAVRPYKRLSKSHLAFSAPHHQRKGAKASQSLAIMLQEVPGLTAGSADNLATRFPSFRALMEAYDDVVDEGIETLEGLVEDCDVGLSTGGPTSRKLGKALSKKVYDVLRNDDPLSLV